MAASPSIANVSTAPELRTSPNVATPRMTGLSSEDAALRLARYGRNELREQQGLSRARVLVAQFRSPLLLLLVFAAIVAALTGQWIDAAIVTVIVLASAGLGFVREYSAQAAAASLRSRIRARVTVVRDGARTSVPIEEVVPGDVVLLSAGSLVPADGSILEACDFFLSEAVLTGESFPVEKREGDRVFLGTNVRSGTARCLVEVTGRETAFGRIAHRLALRSPETEFERGVRRFGYLLTIAMLAMVLLVFVAHVFRGRPPVETLLFAVALAVGLSPELLPAILSVNLARGASAMSKLGVLVRHLNAIENLGSMDVLCTDKTGTLTRGVVQVEGAFDPQGVPSPEVLRLAAINAALETGLENPLAAAILAAHGPVLSGIEKLDEIPFDFTRKRLSIVVRDHDRVRLIAKGAVAHVLEVCCAPPDVEERVSTWNRQGIRVIAVAVRELDRRSSYGHADEHDLTLAGFVTFLDEPKPGVEKAIADLKALGVAVKVITGDTRLVAEHISRRVGRAAGHVVTGGNHDGMCDEALWPAAEATDVFAEVDPNQKERIILALKKTAHVVGFLGDGVNDAPAMHAADTSLSVEQAVDVAREVADFVLLDRDLDVIRAGIEEGRKTFANTLKYVLTTTSANLGNMVSMAVGSLILPFLPLTAGQILLNNFLSDIPAIGIADDAVDPELVNRPRRWDMGFIARFMVEFGILSSMFDLLTFALLIVVLRADVKSFQTAWFVESLLTELVIALVVRTRRRFYRSRPGRLLLYSTIALIVFTLAIPYLPFVRIVGFIPLPASIVGALAAITIAYVLAAEMTKRWFYRHEPASGH
jgi:Mg2+-importing ATPase